MSYEFSNKCLVCPREHNAAPCTNCECSHYCSNECRVVDLPIHKTLCKSFAQFETVPDIDKCRAIYFSVDGSNPEFVWLELDEETDYQQPNIPTMCKDFLGGSKERLHTLITQDMLSMVRTSEGFPEIVLIYGSVPPYTDQPLNKSISALLGIEVHGVRGPVIAYGQFVDPGEDDEEELSITNLDSTDLPVIANWFLGIHREVEVALPIVGVFSNYEQIKRGHRFGQESTMPASILICGGEIGTMSQISIFFGMPLMVILQSEGPNRLDSPVLRERAAKYVSDLPPNSGNRAAALLLIYMGNHIESADEDFGTIPERFRGQLGYAQIFRKDLKPLGVDYLRVFCDWIEDYLLPKFTDANGRIKHTLANEVDNDDRFEKIAMMKEEVWDCCTRKEFYRWCKERNIRLSAL